MPECLSPVIGKNPLVLILGSMPGKRSLEAQMYYAYKTNRFWPVIYRYFGMDFLPDEKEKRYRLCSDNGIALFDTIRNCERESSSLDSDIKNLVPNDIKGIVSRYPTIKAVLLNGRTAAGIYNKHFKNITCIDSIALPSTSSANASYSFEKLFREWKSALDKYLTKKS